MSKILVNKEVLEQALEVLEDWDSPVALPAMVALRAALAEPVQCSNTFGCRCPKHYTAPPQRKPLTEEEIDKIADHLDSTVIGWSTHEFTREIERAHEIGE